MKLQVLSGICMAAMLAAVSPSGARALTADEAKAIAMDAYLFGYSLITTEVTRVQMTNVAEPTGLKAPTGQWINVPRYPPADYRGVSAPNADTLYSVGWMDLTEPQVFSYPAMGDRYFLFEVTDLWMHDLDNSPGTRTYGGDAANVLFTGPGWQGNVPEGMKHIPVATEDMVVLGRIYSSGTDEDMEAVNALQAQIKTTPLSAWGTNFTPKPATVDENPPFSMSDSPQNVILGLGTKGYFDMMADLMCKKAPPAAEDAPMLARMAEIGIEPCKPFDPAALDSATLESLPKDALAKIEANRGIMGDLVDGWTITKGLGSYGTDYLKRAVVGAFGWPANREQDAVYPYAALDGDGATLSGAGKYTLTFAKGEEPPVKAFWSITMYEIDNGWWFTPNALDKFTVSPRDGLKTNEDGSVTLYFQNESPGEDMQTNWLPAPKGDFVLMMRMYWPEESDPSILTGSWTPPKVMKVE